MLRFPSSKVQSPRFQSSRAPKATLIGSAVLLTGLAGCSADVTRFDRSLFDGKSTTGSVHQPAGYGAAPLASQTPERSYNAVGLSRPKPVTTPTTARRKFDRAQVEPVRSADAPRDFTQRVQSRSAGGISEPSARTRPVRVADASPFTGQATLNDATTGSGTIIVRSGDTLYGLARQNRVSVASLKAANGLTSNVIRPGQTLVLPGSSAVTGGARPVLPPQTNAELPRSNPQVTSGTYVVQPGDSLYRIARQTGVSVAQLQDLNGVANVRRLMPGTVLRLSSDARTTASAERLPRRSTRTAAVGNTRLVETPLTSTTPRGLPGGAQVINRPTTTTRIAPRRAEPVTETRRAALDRPKADDGTAKFRWPATGRIISGFGRRPDGSHNDGVDISVPKGTDIRAAEGGVVAYADDELKAYGNLVLIRHDNGWVSAYAHADRLLVKRGDTVRRGQVIGQAGMTGNVKQPTLHFELRDGSTPVDPLPHLPKLRGGA
ncbi:MAG: peptidoglycan DD-metalloendopeptidase family protein [Pseudomonadota bacterium]